jgi:esterase/lipase superfamily enzyme
LNSKTVIFCLALLGLFCQPNAFSKDTPSEATHIQIPVLYVTDRDVDKKSSSVEYGVHRQYLGHCPHDPNMGVATFVIDNTRKIPLDDKLRALGWSDALKEKEGQYSATTLGDNDFAAREKEFDKLVLDAALKTPDKEIYLFMPGYMSTFRSGAESAARIAYYSKHPVILYSWASRGLARAYSADEASVEWSQPHFNRVLERLTQLAAANEGVKIRIYAHSMGNRLLLRAIPKFRGNPTITEVAFVCPDLDAGITLHYFDDYAKADGTVQARLYMSGKDRALLASQILHGGYARFGQAKGYNMLLPADAAAPNEEAAKGRFQRFNFSAIDQGKIGHKIPVSLMCSVSRGDGAPAGLKLIEEDSQSADTKNGGGDATSHPKDYLVKIDKADKENAKYFKPKAFTKQTIFRKDWSLK